MIPYWFLFSIPLILSVIPLKITRTFSNSLLITYSFICFIFIGFRYQVGGDWGVYLDWAITILSKNIYESVSMFSPGFMATTWVSMHSGLGYTGVNLVCASIFIYGIYKFCKMQPYPWLGYVVAFPYLIIVVGMGYTRQAVAIGIALWCFTIWQKREKFSNIKIIFLVLIGILFHKTLLPIIFLILIHNKGRIVNYYNIFFIFLAFIILFFTIWTTQIEQIKNALTFFLTRSNIYKAEELGSAAIISYGAPMRALMNIPPAILFFIFYRKFDKFGDRRLWTIIAIASIILFLLSPYATTFADRIALYCISLQIVVYSRIPLFINYINFRQIYFYGLCILYSLIFFIWSNYSHSSYAWHPYSIKIFQPINVINPASIDLH